MAVVPTRTLGALVAVVGLVVSATGGSSAAAAAARPAAAPPSRLPGYVLVGADGGAFAFGGAQYAGSMAGSTLAAPVSALSTTLDGDGYWMAGQDGGVFALGDAPFEGSHTGFTYHCFGPPGSVCAEPAVFSEDPSPVVGIVRSMDDQGYTAVRADGVVYGYGDAGAQYGGSLDTAAPVIGVAMSADDAGFWIAAADGGVFAESEAPFLGSLGGKRLAAPVVGIAATPDGGGYWLVSADGGVYAFGDAAFYGSLPGQGTKPAAPIVGIAATSDGKGYWLAGADGGVFAFGDAWYAGSMGGKRLAAPIVGIAATTPFFDPPCQPSLTATTDQATYLPGQPVTITLTYSNPSAHSCVGNVGSGNPACSDMTVLSAGEAQPPQLVWNNADEPGVQGASCPPGIYLQDMAPGSSVTERFVWHQGECTEASVNGAPPCPNSQVPDGTYEAWGWWGFNFLGSDAPTFTIG